MQLSRLFLAHVQEKNRLDGNRLVKDFKQQFYLNFASFDDRSVEIFACPISFLLCSKCDKTESLEIQNQVLFRLCSNGMQKAKIKKL